LKAFQKIISHLKNVALLHAFVDIFRNFFIKYGASNCAYAVLGVPIFAKKQYTNLRPDAIIVRRAGSYVATMQVLNHCSRASTQLFNLPQKLEKFSGIY